MSMSDKMILYWRNCQKIIQIEFINCLASQIKYKQIHVTGISIPTCKNEHIWNINTVYLQ